MSIITIPPGLCVQRVDWGTVNYDLKSSFSDTGASQSKRLAPNRWSAAIVAPDKMTRREAGIFSALISALNGQVNKLAVYDMQYPVIAGSARGVWTVSEPSARWSNTLAVYLGTAYAGKTVLKGDLVGVHQDSDRRQLLQVREDSGVDPLGYMRLYFDHALRYALVPGDIVVYDRPTALMERNTTTSSWSGTGSLRGGHSLDMIEVFQA